MGPITKTVLLSIFGGVAFLALVGAYLFVSAGRWDLPWFWAYLGVWGRRSWQGRS
jgi:hypothetical protein